MLAAARHFLHRLNRPSRLLVAISGGSDSTGLLLALHESLTDGHTLCAATVDHELRPESVAEAEAVSGLCAALGIHHRTLRWVEEKPRSGLSAAARRARYRLLKQAAVEMGAGLILTAHTAGDQAETVLMRAARAGEGPGLAGMAEAVLYDGAIWVARPFLGVERQAIRDYLRSRGRSWIDDPSNEDPHYERVRVRAALAQGVAAPDSAAAAARRAALSQKAAEWLMAHAALHGGALAHITPQGLRAEAEVLRFALSGLIATLGGRENGPPGPAMERLLTLLSGTDAQRMTLGRVLAVKRRDGLYLMREQRDLPHLALPPGGQGIWDGRFMVCNASAFAAEIGPVEGVAASFTAPVPISLARRGAASLPHILAPDERADVEVRPVIAPYRLFLPLFDLAFANALAGLCGLGPFTEPGFSR